MLDDEKQLLLYDEWIKRVAAVLLQDALLTAKYERQGMMREAERDFENLLWLLSDFAAPWFHALSIDQEGFKRRVQRTGAFQRLRAVVLSGSKAGQAYSKFLDQDCGICIGGNDGNNNRC